MRMQLGSYLRTLTVFWHCASGIPSQQEMKAMRCTSGIHTKCAFLIARLFCHSVGSGQVRSGKKQRQYSPVGA